MVYAPGQQPSQPQPTPQVDPIQQATQQMLQTLQLQTLRQAVSQQMGTPPVPQQSALSVNMDVAQMFSAAQAQANQSQAAIGEFLKLMATQLGTQERERLQGLQAELKAIQDRLAHPPAPAQAPANPLTQLREYQGFMKEFTQDLRTTLGFSSDPLAARTDDPKALLEARRVEIDGQVRLKQLEHQMESDRFDRNVQFEQWKQEMELKRQEFIATVQAKQAEREESQSRYQGLFEGLTTLLGAVTGAMDVQMGPKGAPAASGPAPRQTPPAAPTAIYAPGVPGVETGSINRHATPPPQVAGVIDCQGCHTRFGVPVGAPQDATVECPTCRMEYGLEAPGALPPRVPAS